MNENHHNVSGIILGRLREKVKFYMEKVCDFAEYILKKNQEMYFDSFFQM